MNRFEFWVFFSSSGSPKGIILVFIVTCKLLYWNHLPFSQSPASTMSKVSLNMMLGGKEFRSFTLVSLLQLPETRTGLAGKGAPFFLWKKGLVTEKKLGDRVCS